MKNIISVSLVLISICTGGCERQSSESVYDYTVVYDSLLASEHINKGEFWLIEMGYPAENGYLDSVSLKYGFRQGYYYCNNDFGCGLSYEQRNGMKDYNTMMIAWLDKINGYGWLQKYNKEAAEFRKRKIVWKLNSIIYLQQ